MSDKKFVGRCKPGKYQDQVEIGFMQKDLDEMQNSMNDKGYVNLRLNKGRQSGKPYLEILIPRDGN